MQSSRLLPKNKSLGRVYQYNLKLNDLQLISGVDRLHTHFQWSISACFVNRQFQSYTRIESYGVQDADAVAYRLRNDTLITYEIYYPAYIVNQIRQV